MSVLTIGWTICGYGKSTEIPISIFSSPFVVLVSKESPHLPYEFTVVGMLERLNAFVEYQVNIIVSQAYNKLCLNVSHLDHVSSNAGYSPSQASPGERKTE